MRIVEGTNVKAGGETPPEEHWAGKLHPDDRDALISTVKYASKAVMQEVVREHFAANPISVPKAPKGAIWIASVIGALIFVGTMLTATLWGVSAIRIASSYQERLYENYYNQTKSELLGLEQKQAITNAYVIDIRTALAAQGVNDPLHEP